MTKAEIIRTTVERLEVSLQNNPQFGVQVDDLELVVVELQDVLPYDVDIRTCEDFKHLGVRRCETCHGENAHYEMALIALPDGGQAWVCDSVRWAINPKHQGSRNSPEIVCLYQYRG
jgi:hypothetical protein